MKYKVFQKISTVLLAVIFAVSTVAYVSAAEINSPIVADASGSLSLTYKSGDKVLAGQDIEAYHVASVSSNAEYTLTPAFKDYPVNVKGITSQNEWNDVTATLNAYILSDSVAPTKHGTTDSNGKVTFDNLDTGLYLIRRASNGSSDAISGFDPFIISVPSLDDSGDWIYDIDSYPKPGSYVPTGDEIEYKTVVLWDDAGHESERPANVGIKVSKNGNPVKTHTVSPDNNWSCKWNATDDGSEWTVVETGAGNKYDTTVSKSGNIFTVINHYKDNSSGGNGNSSGGNGDSSGGNGNSSGGNGDSSGGNGDSSGGNGNNSGGNGDSSGGNGNSSGGNGDSSGGNGNSSGGNGNSSGGNGNGDSSGGNGNSSGGNGNSSGGNGSGSGNNGSGSGGNGNGSGNNGSGSGGNGSGSGNNGSGSGNNGSGSGGNGSGSGNNGNGSGNNGSGSGNNGNGNGYNGGGSGNNNGNGYNGYNGGGYDPLKTGDDSRVNVYAALMIISGVACVIIGVAGRRRKNEK